MFPLDFPLEATQIRYECGEIRLLEPGGREDKALPLLSFPSRDYTTTATAGPRETTTRTAAEIVDWWHPTESQTGLFICTYPCLTPLPVTQA